ncbi:MAG: hypothetical protein WC829_02625 [Hyphomicrobium sp.]|jgi:hypothetical protein
MSVINKIKEMVGAKTPPESNAAESKKRIADLWGKDAEARKPLEQNWQLHVSMVMGNQWAGWNGMRVVPLVAPSWRVQSVNNKLFVHTRAKMTQMLQDTAPQFLPESADHTDIRRARYKERVLNHVLREIGIDLVKARAAQWVSVCGECFLEAFWDATAGDTFADDAGAFSDGDVGLKVRSPFEVWPGAGASVGNCGGRLWTADVMPVELARLKFNKVKDIAPDAGEVADMQLRANMESFFQSGGVQSFGQDRKNFEDSVMVKTLREYRTRALPKGRISTIINGVTVEEKDLLWDSMTQIINFPSFGSYHGDAVELRLSIQPQKSINKIESNWEEYHRTMAKGKILAHKSQNIKTNQFDSENAEIITYDGPGQAPTPWMPPPMNSDTSQLIQNKTACIEDIYSMHGPSQGKSPASASGAAINYLVESDQAQHTIPRDLWNAGWERIYGKIIEVVAGKSGPNTGYKAGRMITILGADRRADVQPIDVAMLEGANRVKIVIGGGLPSSKVLRSEVVRRMFTDGMLGDPAKDETKRRAMKMTDAGIFDDVFDRDALDEIRAEKENRQLAIGTFVAPRPEDNHLVHIWVHEKDMKTDEFLERPIDLQELAYDHLETHKTAMVDPAALLAALTSKGKGPIPATTLAPSAGGASGVTPPQPNPASSPDMQGPVNMLKSVQQGGEPPSSGGAPGLPT